ncbi:MAG TPA: nucleotidyltransferase family protein, partial [Bryobacteraceae bacterium]
MTTTDARIPDYARRVLASLRFLSPERAGLRMLTEQEWKSALTFCDRAHLTLPLGLECRDHLPEWAARRVDGNLANNAERWRRVQVAYNEASCAFEGEGLEWAVLKGFSHHPRFVADPRHRPHGDFDLFFPADRVFQAREAALRLGYEPLPGFERLPIDHLPVMIRKTGWRWRGDYFDPENPPSLELHFRFWDQRTEHFAPSGLEQFWERRQSRAIDQVRFGSLHPVDAAGYASLHLLRHLLRGDLRPYHVYELAFLLDRSSTDDLFWRDWYGWHDPSLRRLEAICFDLARRWFDCRMPDA